jgi:hypothetical protein
VVAKLHSNWPFSSTETTLLNTCAASALLNDAPPRAAAAQVKYQRKLVMNTSHSLLQRACSQNLNPALLFSINGECLQGERCTAASWQQLHLSHLDTEKKLFQFTFFKSWGRWIFVTRHMRLKPPPPQQQQRG